MRIYSVDPSEGYELCHPKNQKDFERINIPIDGTERMRTWSPISSNDSWTNGTLRN